MRHITAALVTVVAGVLLLLGLQQAALATQGTRVELTVPNLPIGG